MPSDPVWDRSGKYLFFTASTDSGSSLQPDIQAMTRTPTSSIYLIVLDKDDPSPLSPQSDEEAAPDRSKADGAKPAAGAGRRSGPDAARTRLRRRRLVTIDFDNILQRVLALPMPPRAVHGAAGGKGGHAAGT